MSSVLGVSPVLATTTLDERIVPFSRASVARKPLNYTYLLGKANRPAEQSAALFVRKQLGSLGLGAELIAIPWGTKKPPLALPPSKLPVKTK